MSRVRAKNSQYEKNEISDARWTRLPDGDIDAVWQTDDGVSLLRDLSHVDAHLVGAGGIGHVDVAVFDDDRRNPQGALDRDRTVFREPVASHDLVSLFNNDRSSVAVGDYFKGEERPGNQEARKNDKDA